ncbi:MAG TPA: hypothetical protein VIV01_02020 [Hyphomicrobiaceae bacterium]|jgi:hypothetical protein
MAKTAKKKVAKPAAKKATKRSGAARRKPAAKRRTASKARGRKRAA